MSTPFSAFAEESVVGALILDNKKALDAIAGYLVESDFYMDSNRLIFSAISDLSETQTPFDILTVSEKLSEKGNLEAVGGLSALIEIIKKTPSSENVRYYADIVRDKSIRRKLINAGIELSNKTEMGDISTAELIGEFDALIDTVSTLNQDGLNVGLRPLRGYLKSTIEKIETLSESDKSMTGYTTGFADLDTLTSGLQAADLIIVAGRPSMGKTSFSMNVAENFAIKTNKSVAIFSLEMPAESLTTRMISSIGGIEQQKVRTGTLDDGDWANLTVALKTLAATNIHIDDSSALTVNEIAARARKLARESELGLIVIDYLQLITSTNNKANKVQQITEISRGLKMIAKELNVPVIALSQLNRSLESRPNKRPMLSDLRESGAIEQDADLVLFLYRDDYYNDESPDKGTAELIIAKHRNGSLGTVRLAFQGKYSRFKDCANASQYSNYED